MVQERRKEGLVMGRKRTPLPHMPSQPGKVVLRTPIQPTVAEKQADSVLTPEEIFHQHAPRVYHLARRLLGNAADAEDVTQDVFVQVVRKLPTFRGEAAFSTWLYRVTVNAALAYRRKRGMRQMERLPEPLEDFGEDGKHRAPVRSWMKEPSQEALDQETHQQIEEAIAGLPEIYRGVYVLADVEELSAPGIAALLGLTVTAVKSRLHRARLLMRKALAPYFEEQAA
jgi:RNA polymerase sigma-70 factor, ECF subfamily